MFTYRRLLNILSVTVILSMMFSAFSVPVALAQSGDGIKREHNTHTGKVSFIGPESGRSLSAAKALGISSSARPADPAMALAKRFGPEFGLKNPARDLQAKKTDRSDSGRLAVHYQQSYNGIPVMGGELIVNTNEKGDLYSISGEISSSLSLSTQPTVDSGKARQTALEGAAKWYQKAAEDFVVSEPELWVYDESLLQPSTRPAELVWRMEMTPKDVSISVRELVLVNAVRGNISLHFNQVDTAWSFSGKTDTVQDIQPTATPQPTETPLPTETPEIINTATPTPTPAESSNEKVPDVSKGGITNLAVVTWYVATTGNDSNSCSVVASPCATIQAAINKAANGDIINVAEGTYYYTSINVNPNVVIINKSLTLSGGWQNDFSSQAGASIIDGQNTNNGILANAAGSTVVVDHFVIQNSRTGSDSGGIYLYSNNFTLKNSSVINNTGGRGAGVFTIGNVNLTVLNSTLSGNKAGTGGAIFAVNGTVTINNSTIAHNNATNIGGGLRKDSGTVSIQNSILALNTATTSGPDCSGSMDSSNHNIIGNTAGCTITSGAGDQFNVAPLIDSALTGTLPLYILQLTSPAINAGDNTTCLSIDQRGLPRPQGSACDIGSYELVTSKGISVLGGSGQIAQISTAFGSPLSVLVVDDLGDPVSGLTVTFTAPSSSPSGTFGDSGSNVTTAITGSNGVATSAIFTANDQIGEYSVNATAVGYESPAVFDLSNTPISIANLYVSLSGSDANNSCTSPAVPCLTIDTAIYWAVPGDTIAVANGIYTGSGSSVVGINKAVKLSGGWDNTFDVQNGRSIIDGQGARRSIFNSAVGASVENFMIRGGYDATQGGGIYNSGTLAISNSEVSGNTSGWMGSGIYNRGTLTINDTSISNNRGPSSGSGGGGGAGIMSYSGTVIMNNSTVSDNVIGSGYQGSGIVNYGNFTLNNSTVSGNTGADAIYNLTGTLTLNNSTVSNNAKYGIRREGGTVTIQNSILAKNYTSASGQDCVGTITSSGYNLIGNTAGCTFTPSMGDQTNVNPMISAYPVGFPPYHTLLNGSPAINAGNPATCLVRDQRGLTRPQGSTCDIGAYEYIMTSGPAASFGIVSGNNQRAGISLPFALSLLVYVVDASGSPVSDASVTFTGPASGPSGTFADTGTNITTVSTNSEGVAIPSTFIANSQWGTYNLTATVSGFSSSLTFILTNGAWFVSPTGNDANSCSSAAAPCLTISNAMIKAANVDVINVAVGTYSPIAITKSLIISGGWDSTFGSQIGYSTISGSSTTKGITASAPNISISRFIVRNSDFGIYHNSGVLSFAQGALIGNHNGIYNLNGDTTFTNTTLSGNHPVSYSGGAISNIDGTVQLRYSTITNNAGSYAINSTNSGAHIEIGNSILAGNDGADCNIGSANMVSTGHNIFGRSPVCSGTSSFVPQSTDQVGVDPKFSTTLLPRGYHAISSSSPAVDHADSASCPSTDQRGVTRPQGNACDVGAYEYTVPGPADSFGVVDGSDQHTAPSTPFLLPLTVYVTDVFGSPVSGVNITFIAPASGPSGTFADTGTNTTTVVTQEGLASSSVFTANSQLGSYGVIATASGLSGSLSFALTNSAWFVSPAGSDANSCNLPNAPCLTINGAINKATSGDSIKVAVGTYSAISITKSLALSGGWDNTFSSQIGFSTVNGSATSHGISVSAEKVSISRFVVQNSDFGIYHSSGTLNFDQGASINNSNGLYNLAGNATFTNTTISGNHAIDYAGSGISNVSGTVRLQYSTITNNIGTEAIWSANGSAYIDIGNSILAGNPAGDCYVRGPNMTSRGHNIFGSSPICETFVSAVTPDPTDQIKVSPKLLPLFPSGYHPLLMGSPAIDAADPLNCPAKDQRNTTRPVGARCDIGAFEYNPTVTAPKYIFAYEGTPQLILVNTPAPYRLKAIVVDQDGDSVQGVPVTFIAPENGASAVFADTGTNTSTAVTDADGFAVSPEFSANSTRGNYIVAATANGIETPASFSLSNTTITLDPKIQTYTANNSTVLPGTFLCDQTQLNCTNGMDSHADAAHKYAMGTYALYGAEHLRYSIDNAGMTIISSIHYASAYANAGWTGSQMVYGDAYGFALADDVVAHELTHGVTQYESNLFYYYQSGAINESFSDLWGEYYDQTNGQGNDSEDVKWLMGEDVSGLGAIRNMSNPPQFGDPDKMSSLNYYTGAGDNGGVHTNSGVNNKAAFLMVQGGSFNGKTVSALGWEKTAAIYYEANTNLLFSGADYSDLYYALQQACTNLVGQKGITTGDCAEVKNAIDAVEMNAQPIAGYNPDAPYCDPGNSPVIIFSDDLESGISNWTFSNGTYPRWQLDSPDGPNAHSGAHSLYANDYPGTVTDASARLAAIPIPTNAYLHFAHAYDFQTNYDGGVLEYSADGGTTWQDAGSLIDFNGYTGLINSTGTNPLKGRVAFSGSSHGYTSTRLDLASLSGQTVTFRWRMGLDSSGYMWGWWLDDVKVYQCSPTDTIPPTVASIVRAGANPTNISNIDFTVAFSEPVTGVDVSDFALNVTGNVVGANITNVTGSDSTWTVTVNTGSGDGTFGLNVPVDADMKDLAGNSLGGLPFTGSEQYTIDKTAPVISSIVRANADPASAASVNFIVTFSEPVMGVDENDFALNVTGSIVGASITNVTGSDSTWTVTVNTGSGDGTLGLRVPVGVDIQDAAGNSLGSLPFTEGEQYTIERTRALLLTPDNGVSLPYRRPAFDWSDVPGASAYRITISKSSSFSTVLGEVDTTDSTYIPPADLPGGQVIYWRVRAQVNGAWGLLSETRSFTTANPPSIPVLSSPATASLTKDYTPLLDWKNSTVPTGAAAFDHYEVQVATDNLFTNSVLIDASTPTGQITASSYTPTTDLAPNATYFWRVRSYNTSGQYSTWSTVWSFRTALLPPSNLTPKGGATVSSLKPILQWDTVEAAEGYSIQISTSSSFSSLLVNTTVTTNIFTPSANLPTRKTIYWRVQTTGTNGPSSWTTASFKTP